MTRSRPPSTLLLVHTPLQLGMKERFGMYRLRGDGPAKVPELPPIHRLHDHPRFRPTWIDYSALDAKVGVRVCVGGRVVKCQPSQNQTKPN